MQGPQGTERSAYRAFWGGVGADFPSLKGAASTSYYRECEKTLCRDLFPDLAGKLLLKTDLWDEAKNTEILQWAAAQGARVAGIDIALETARGAKALLGREGIRVAAADVRELPFPADTFDLVYSMGTIEHFVEYRAAVDEIFRVLKPGGTAVVGVPNKLDPFLRPALVHLLNRLGLYAYGMEKSFTPAALRRLLSAAGFRVGLLSGILFMPGWLRMLDLAAHVRRSRLAPATAAAIAPFAWLYRNVPAVRRHGYLIACAGVKPR